MRIFTILAVLAVSTAVAAPPENPFALWVEHSKRAATGPTSRLRVEASGVVIAGEPALHFIVTNTSSVPLSLAESGLPWGNAYSVNVVGIRPNGKALPPSYPIDDPGVGDVALQPKATLEGNYFLHRALQGAREALGASDLIVLWSYGATTGAVLLRKQ